MTVTAVIPVRDGERYLAEAIDSVLAEPEITEVIVVDDGSTDSTPEIIAGYGDRVRGLHQPPAGSPAALNHGVRAATGEWIAFQDADDVWVPGRLAALLAGIGRGADGAYGLVQQFASPDVDPADLADTRIDLAPHPAPLLQNLLVRRDVFARIGGFDESLVVGANLDWISRAQVSGLELAHVPTVSVRRRIHASNLGRQIGATARNEAFFHVLRNHLDRRRSGAAGD